MSLTAGTRMKKLLMALALVAIAFVLVRDGIDTAPPIGEVSSHESSEPGGLAVAVVVYIVLAIVGAIAWHRRGDETPRRLLPRRRVLPRPSGERGRQSGGSDA